MIFILLLVYLAFWFLWSTWFIKLYRSNTMQFHPCVVINIQNIQKEKIIQYTYVGILTIFLFLIDFILFSLTNIPISFAVAVGCKSSQTSYNWWYEIISSLLLILLSVVFVRCYEILFSVVNLYFFSRLGFRKTDESLLQESAAGKMIY